MPSTGDVLLLAKLGRAVGSSVNYTTLTKLAADGRGSTGTETKMSHFYISAVSTMTVPDTTPNSNTSSTATVYFSNAGSLFLSRIANRTQNFTWDETVGHDHFTLTEASDYTAPISYATTFVPRSIAFTAKFYEGGQSNGFNDHATNYNTVITETAVIQESGGGGS
jgi:hypothetical protein|tara:strand:- start:192 stop:689 length:498 start_codon:yes stop_codon:yes gene_type:complete